MPACTASLRRVGGRDLLDPTNRLALQSRGQQTPSAAADATVEATLLCHALTGVRRGSSRRSRHSAHIKCFYADRVEAPRDVGAGLFDPVLAPVGFARLELGDRPFRTSSPRGAALCAGQALLQHSQPFRFTCSQARGVQQFTSRQRRRHRHTAVDTHHAPVTATSDRIRYVRERDMPATGPITGDAVRLHPARDRPRHAQTHPADLGHPDPTESAVELLDVTRFEPDLPKTLMYTGFAPRRAAVRAPEEVTHRLREIPQRLLLHRLRAGRQPFVLGAGCGQLSTLLVVAGPAAPRLPMPLLLNCQIPHIPGMATMFRQQHRLLSGRNQPVSRHVNNVTAATDNTPKGDAVITPLPKARRFHAATNP